MTVKWIEEINVLADKLVEVPTGMLGPENLDEVRAERNTFSRVPVPKRLRFLVLRRDDYKCQLCGRRGQDGVPLEIDHKVPVSRGGLNDEENLWVLCEDCNQGRSNLPLTLATAVEATTPTEQVLEGRSDGYAAQVGRRLPPSG